MDDKNLLYEVIKKFNTLDLSMARIDNLQMGYIFEALIRIGAEQSNAESQLFWKLYAMFWIFLLEKKQQIQSIKKNLSPILLKAGVRPLLLLLINRVKSIKSPGY